MDLSLRITSLGDTTPREISAASAELRDVLERLPGVERVAPHHVAAPGGAKGFVADALGSLAVSLAPTVVKALFQTLQSVLSRQLAATKVSIETKDGKFSFEFDPKKISLQELVSAAERLGAAPRTG